jgi:hypothetical protein
MGEGHDETVSSGNPEHAKFSDQGLGNKLRWSPVAEEKSTITAIRSHGLNRNSQHAPCRKNESTELPLLAEAVVARRYL